MSETFEINQMKLMARIGDALSDQFPDIEADIRMNAIIEASEIICNAYRKTVEEYIKHVAENKK